MPKIHTMFAPVIKEHTVETENFKNQLRTEYTKCFVSRYACAPSWLPTFVSDCATSTWRIGAILNPSLALTGSNSSGLDDGAHMPTPPPRPPPPPSSPPPPTMDSFSNHSSDQKRLSSYSSSPGSGRNGGHRRFHPLPPATPPPPPSFGHHRGRSAAAEASRASHPLTLILKKLADKTGGNEYGENEEVFDPRNI